MTGHPRFPLIGPLVALTAALALLPASARAQNNNQAAEIATYHGPDREKRLIEGAKKEGELMFYASDSGGGHRGADRGLHQEIRHQGQGVARGFRGHAPARAQRGQGAPL